MLFFVKFFLLTIIILFYSSSFTKFKLIWIIYIEVINILIISLFLLLGSFFGEPLFISFALTIMVLGAVEFVLFTIFYICFFSK